MSIARTFVAGALALGAVRAGAQGSVTGIVYDSLAAHAALAGATVVLVELDRYATSDARGRFRFDSVPDGRYTLGFTHAVLDSLGIELPVVPVDVARGHRAAVTLATPSLASAYAKLCPAPREPDTGVIMGRVSDVDDHAPLAGATVNTDWTEYTLNAGRPASHRMRVAARTDARGVYLLCGVPTDVPVELRTERAGVGAGPVLMSLKSRILARLDFAMSRSDSAARLTPAADSTRTVAGAHGTASLVGVVRGTDGRVVGEAVVEVLGTARSARTNASGAFRLDEIPAGTRSVEVTSIGLLPQTVKIDFPTHGVLDTTFYITRQAQGLKADSISGRASATKWMNLEGFEARRSRGLGEYETGDEIAKHNYPDLAAVLRDLRGVRVECSVTKRGMQGVPCFPKPWLLGISDLTGEYCKPNFYVDGAPFTMREDQTSFLELSATLPPSSIRAIEIYSNPGTIPAQFDMTSSTGCGSIVIWTH